MVPPPADQVVADEFIPMPGDDQPVTRGEWRRGIGLMTRRLERVERLCFNDELDEATGKVARPSLDTLMKRVDAHITVMCSWARVFKLIVAAVLSLGGLVLLGLQLWGIR